jgi:thioredoxin 1
MVNPQRTLTNGYQGHLRVLSQSGFLPPVPRGQRCVLPEEQNQDTIHYYQAQGHTMALATNTQPTALLSVTESNFGRSVLNSALPVVALFGSRACPASRALRPLLNELASVYAGTIRFATINAEQSPLIAEQFGFQITPTLIVVQHGEIATRVVGFVAPELLRLLCDQVASGTLPLEPFWSPVEATFEDVVVVPLLEAWGFTYLRQAACPTPARGRIDFLVYDQPDAPALTLFENKRQLASAQALAQAAAQAHRYARALNIASFVVAAPAGLWIYAATAKAPVAVRRVTSLELQQQIDDVPRMLRGLRAG